MQYKSFLKEFLKETLIINKFFIHIRPIKFFFIKKKKFSLKFFLSKKISYQKKFFIKKKISNQKKKLFFRLNGNF